MSPDARHTNRLAQETSPYLLQHAHNPVDWYPWGPEALELAQASDKPIFLSIGYSACHWCHVMERESFENEQVAALMNEHFINIKVDREERPDLDDIYMRAVQRMTGAGGWPMSVFLTPDLKPFHGGTYFPPLGAYGRPGFSQLLRTMAEVWKKERDKVQERGEQFAEHIAAEGLADGRDDVGVAALDRSLAMLRDYYDDDNGGFGSAPKFPHALDLRLLLRHHLRTGAQDALDMATFSLEKMMCGGVYDQLGGGFHRYSTDDEWLIPHFEKMLYDNTLLIPAYLEAYLVTGRADFERIARECCDWALREMLTPEGAFASTQDADSEGEEGRFFAWTPDQLTEVLGRKLGAQAQEWYGVTDNGNFEHGTSALHRPQSAAQVAAQLRVPQAELEEAMRAARKTLFEARAARVHPGWDDKVLTAWNGLMISALAMAYQVLGDERYLAGAQSAATYVMTCMRRDDGRLFATARAGRVHIEGCLDDYAFFIQGLIDLYESDFDEGWLQKALALNDILGADFWDAERDGYFTTGARHETLIARLKSPQDGALPAGNGVQALNLLRLAELTGQAALARRARATMDSSGTLVNRHPAAFSQFLLAVDFLEAGPRQVVIAGERGDRVVRDMLTAVRKSFLPQRVVARAHADADEDLIPLLDGRGPGPTGARAFVCRNYACQLPVDTAEDLESELCD